MDRKHDQNHWTLILIITILWMKDTEERRKFIDSISVIKRIHPART